MASNIRSIPEGTPFEFIEGNCMGDTGINNFTVSYSLGNITAIVGGAYSTLFNNITTIKDIRSNILFFGVNQYTITISSTTLTFNKLGYPWIFKFAIFNEPGQASLINARLLVKLIVQKGVIPSGFNLFLI